jgi:hypothetical protein
MAGKKYTPEKRIAIFWSRVDMTGGMFECWEWTATRDSHGYGKFWWGEKMTGSHRVSWEITNGVVPDGLFVLHKCDNPPCVNPSHLWLGTKKDNSEDCVRKGRSPRGERQGMNTHPECRVIGERNGSHKLTEQQVVEIRSRYAQGNVTQTELGIEFNVTKSLIWCIVHNKAWRYIA